MVVCNLVAVRFWPRMSVGRLPVALFPRFVFVGMECLLLCGVSDDRPWFIASSVVCWLLVAAYAWFSCSFCLCHCCCLSWRCMASVAFSV